MAIIIIEDVPKDQKEEECARARVFGAISCKVVKDHGDMVDIEIVFPDKEKLQDRITRTE